VAHYGRHAAGLPAVVFCVSVRHAEDVAEAFRAAGWRAVAFSGETPAAERDAAIAGLADGRVQVLCNCDALVHGPI
jgi:superfamily II DNA or RNA helicase